MSDVDKFIWQLGYDKAMAEWQRDDAKAEAKALRAEVERLKAEVERLDSWGALRRLNDEWTAHVRSVAERQREACAKALVALGPCGHLACDDEDSRHRCTCDETIDGCVDAVRATPLVTEVEL